MAHLRKGHQNHCKNMIRYGQLRSKASLPLMRKKCPKFKKIIQTKLSCEFSKTKMRPKFTFWSDSLKVSEIICGITVQ